MIGKVKNYFISSYEEMRKVVWPNRQEITSHSVIVVSSIIIGMGIVALIDYGLFNLIQTLISNK